MYQCSHCQKWSTLCPCMLKELAVYAGLTAWYGIFLLNFTSTILLNVSLYSKYFIILFWITLTKFSFLLKIGKYTLWVLIYFLNYLARLFHICSFLFSSRHDHGMISEFGIKSEEWERILFVSATVKNSSISEQDHTWYKKKKIPEL